MAAIQTLEISSDILESARMTVGEAKLELAIALFALERLSMGKAAELAELSVERFHRYLGARGMGPHYGVEDAFEDLAALDAARQ